MENLSFQYPVWFILFCLFGALLYVILLYWRSPSIDPRHKWLQPLLAFLRFLPILSMGLLLMGPMLRQILEESKQPSVVILNDNSKSVGTWLDQQSGRTQLEADMTNLKTKLSDKYAVSSYAFGDEVSNPDDSLTYDDDITNLNKAIQYINDVYEGENLGAIILATDAIYNAGQNPLYTSTPGNIPIHSIALGDTSQRTDVSVQMVLHNEVAYLNDEMLTQIDIKAINAANQVLRLTVEKESAGGYTTIHTKNISVRGNDFFTTEEVTLAFDAVGIQHYRYRISSVNSERNQSNNRKDIYIDVLDARQEIGIVAAAPHPDITALKQLLEQNKNYQVSLYLEDPSTSELSDLDLVIFHNLPARNRNLKGIINTLDNRKTPRVYIIGGSTSQVQFNDLQDLVTITGQGGSTNDAQAHLEASFENFTLSDRLKVAISQYPPLSSPFGEYSLSGNVQTLLYQSIGDITTDFPLLSFSDVNGIKTTFLFGNDIWRWKLFDFLQNDNFNVITELLDKTVTYTSTKEDKRKFRVSANNNIFYMNEDISFVGELYNNSYELVNDPEATIKITADDGSTYDYTFSKNSKLYGLDIGRLNAGSYKYLAETIFNGERHIVEGRFVVREVQYELYDLEAQHNLLYALSQKTKGTVHYPDDIKGLGDLLSDSDNMKPVIYQNVISKPLIDTKWLFLLLVLPLITEWVLRRYFGSL